MATTAAWLLIGPRDAHAERTAFELAWSAPAECPSGEQIVEATRARLGPPRADELEALVVHGEVTPERGGFRVALTLNDRSGNLVGKRQVRVEGPSCNAVAEATALMLAMTIAARPRGEPPSDSQVEATPAPRPTSTGTPEPAPPSPPPLRSPDPVSRPSTAPRRLVMAAGAVVSRGVLPTVGGGVALRGTYSPVRPVPFVVLGIEASFETGGAVRDGTSEVNFQLLSASALGGVQVVYGPRLELVILLGARAGAIRTFGTGFHATQDDLRAIALVGPGALLRAKLAPALYVEAFPQAEAVLIRDRFQIRDGQTLEPIHRPALVTGRFSLGIAYEFR